MSRTYKDKKWAIRYPENDLYFGKEKVPYTRIYTSHYTGEEVSYTSYVLVDLPGAKRKKKRYENGEWMWFRTTPSWWTSMVMNKPKRRACKIWERQVLTSDVEEADCPDYGNKPHVYYY